MLNALTIDVEDYFQVHAFSDVIKCTDWDCYECRVERNTYRILEILSEVKTPCTPRPLSGVGRQVPRNPRPSGRGQGAQYEEATLPESAALQGGELYNPQYSAAGNSGVKATFFCLGWIAERYPTLVKEICQQGHEIACHGYAHQLIYHQTRKEFREDVRKAKFLLEDISGCEVIGYRAPSYSITDKSTWAFEILIAEGFKYDSSIFPIYHDFYGMPQAPRSPFLVTLNGNPIPEFSTLGVDSDSHGTSFPKPRASVCSSNRSVMEFPISTTRRFGRNIPIAGGGYFRLFPFSFVKSGLSRINRIEKKPFTFYMHPWEIDHEQPRIRDITPLSRFRHYINLNKTEKRFTKLLNHFLFAPIRELLRSYRFPV